MQALDREVSHQTALEFAQGRHSASIRSALDSEVTTDRAAAFQATPVLAGVKTSLRSALRASS